jgi:hypothetical protein
MARLAVSESSTHLNRVLIYRDVLKNREFDFLHRKPRGFNNTGNWGQNSAKIPDNAGILVMRPVKGRGTLTPS